MPANRSDDDISYWKAFKNLVKVCDIPIIVNSFFLALDEFLEEGCHYDGTGFNGIFWFEFEKDLDDFFCC